MAARKKSSRSKRDTGSKARTRAAREPAGGKALPRPWSEFLGVALFAVGVLMLGGLLSYQSGAGTLMGPVGHLVAAGMYASFGMAAYLITLGVFGMGVKALRGEGMEISLGEGVGFSVATLAGCVLLHVMFPAYRVHGYTAGGLAGELVGEVSLGMLAHAGTYLVALTLICVGLIASTPLSAQHLVTAGRAVVGSVRAVGVYLGGGIAELIRTQRDPGPMEDELDEELAALDDELAEEAWDEDEEAYEGEDEVEDEEEVVEVAPPKKKSRRRTARKAKTADEDAEEEASDTVAMGEALETDLEVPAPKRTRKTGNRKRKSTAATSAAEDASATDAQDEETPLEVPEIVVRTEPVAPAEGPATAPNGKKAPPRPEELAEKQAEEKASQQKPIEAFKAKAAAPKKPPKSPPGAGSIVRLTDGPFELPPSELFASAESVQTDFDRKFVLEQAQRLVTTLGEFKIRGKVTKIHPGPVITRYEFKPEAGVKLSKIESLENDIAMALEAIRIRILAPIPGKATVGFEVPNKSRETVYIKEILDQENFGQKQKLPLALGKDITGNIRVTDLAKAPHLLVAGATGSGKSVGVNSMICSLLYTRTPEEVRMIMIDPKMLELSIYEGIPHLLLPVVTDPEKAALALRWAVQEMERRYTLLSEAQVRDITGYNKKLPELQAAWEKDRRLEALAEEEMRKVAAEQGEDMADGKALSGVSFNQNGPVESYGGGETPDCPERMPYIVVIIDEFADLMMVASKEVEQSVARIAAKARAAGIHLIVATQRPSVDVITGTIKNNFPSRIAFQVTSDTDSRTIIDGKGAKQLLGMGDMLHMDRGTQPNRVHGCFVSEDEILKVVDFVKKQAKPVYNMDVVRKPDEDGSGPSDENLDPLYDRAVEVVAEAQKVSTSMIQRRLGVGYNRAAKIVECMEERGVIGPSRGTTPREVFVSPH
ncbi:MAG: DNA translocase FtsK 4TM domain-containing protein [Myxococcota bacterium]